MQDELSRVQVQIPKWLPLLYAAVAIGLIPWINVLFQTLPSRHLSHHWDLAWTGFDIAMLVMIVLTAYLAAKRSGWVAITAISVATLLVVDAWFDVLTSRPGVPQREAILLAVLIELPLAALSFWLSHKATSELVGQKKP